MEINKMGMELWLTRAGIGDCILVRCGEKEKKANILIDSGQGAGVFEDVLRRLAWNGERLDLLVLTHDDNDHVKGAANLLCRIYEKERTPAAKEAQVRQIVSGLDEERILFNFGGNGTEALLAAEDVRRLAHALEGEIDFRKLGFVLSDEKADEANVFSNQVRLMWEASGDGITSEVIRKPGKKEIFASKGQKEHLELVILSPKREMLLRYVESAFSSRAQETPLYAGREKKPMEWDHSIQYWFEHPKEFVCDSKPANNASISFLLRYGDKCGLFAGDASPEEMLSAGRRYLRQSKSSKDFMELDFMKLPHHGSSHNVSLEFLSFFRTKSYLVSTSGHAGYKHPGKGTFAEIAAVLKPGEKADIYSSYDWWFSNPVFWEAEKWEQNWEGNRCVLKDEAGNAKYLEFHMLGAAPLEIGKGILLRN